MILKLNNHRLITLLVSWHNSAVVTTPVWKQEVSGSNPDCAIFLDDSQYLNVHV